MLPLPSSESTFKRNPMKWVDCDYHATSLIYEFAQLTCSWLFSTSLHPPSKCLTGHEYEMAINWNPNVLAHCSSSNKQPTSTLPWKRQVQYLLSESIISDKRILHRFSGRVAVPLVPSSALSLYRYMFIHWLAFIDLDLVSVCDWMTLRSKRINSSSLPI